MVSGHEQMRRFTTAARTLMEEGHVDADAGRFSKTLFVSTTARSSDHEKAAMLAAAEQGWSMITLQFGPTGRAKGPQDFTVSLLGEDGRSDIVHGCLLARDDQERFVLVPRSATHHLAIGPNGLERRHGRPANIAASAIRARRSLAEEAKRADPNAPCMEIHCLKEVA